MNRVKIEPSYKTFEGWKKDISGVKNYNDMPAQMNTYIDYLNNFIKIPVKYISNGPGREQIVAV
jgi:adenylosuccinate synthase